MGANVCQMDCVCERMETGDAGKSSSSKTLVSQLGVMQRESSEDVDTFDDALQAVMDQESTATPPPLEDATDDNIARGVELATAIFLNAGGDDAWGDPPSSAGPDSPPLPLDTIIKAQQEICQKVVEQDEQIRRILQGCGGQASTEADLGRLFQSGRGI
mmetsp:Transcript_88727/g.275838  ORF Transcript_88727/g.275838 Transcript_88727/m.275838 type:complete len:159 (+) Transcript_88727:41-517(+)